MSTKDEYFIDGRGMTAEEHDEALQRAEGDRAPKANVCAGFGGGGGVGSVLNVTMVSSSLLAGVEIERDHARHDAETWSARAVEAESSVGLAKARIVELEAEVARLRIYLASLAVDVGSDVKIQLAANIHLVDSLREKLIKQATNHNNQLAALQAQIDRSDAIVTERDEQLEAMVKALARSERELAGAVSRDDEEDQPAKGEGGGVTICECGGMRDAIVHAPGSPYSHVFRPARPRADESPTRKIETTLLRDQNRALARCGSMMASRNIAVFPGNVTLGAVHSRLSLIIERADLDDAIGVLEAMRAVKS